MRKGSTAFAVKTLGAALAFAMNIVIARVTDPTIYGIYVFTLGWVALAGLGMRWGLDLLVVRLVAKYRDVPKRIGPVIRWVYKRLLMQTGMTLLVAAVILFLLRPQLSQAQFSTLLIAGPLLIFVSWNAIAQSVVQGLGKAHALLPDQVIRPAGLMLIVGTWVALNQPSPDSVQLIAASSLAALVTLIISFVWSRNLVQPGIAEAPINDEERGWNRALVPLFFITGANVLLSQTDILLLGILADDSDVGVYGAASRVVVLVTFALTAINTILAPMIANLWAIGDAIKLQAVVTMAVRISFGVSFILAALLWFGAELVMSLFGADFIVAVSVLKILLVGQMINAFVGSVGVIQMMTGHERAAAWFMGFAVLFNFGLNLILIPRYGIVGAAVGTACATACWNLCGAIYVRRNLGIRSTPI